MARSAKIGAMNTRIRIKNVATKLDADGYRIETETDAIRGCAWCMWRWTQGKDELTDRKLQNAEAATITMRYTPKVNQKCRIYLCSEGEAAKPFEVTGIWNIDDGRAWMEIKVERRVKA